MTAEIPYPLPQELVFDVEHLLADVPDRENTVYKLRRHFGLVYALGHRAGWQAAIAEESSDRRHRNDSRPSQPLDLGAVKAADAEWDRLRRERNRLSRQVEAVRALAADPCENFTEGACPDYGRTPDARYVADRYCWPCRLRAALASAEGPEQ